MPDQPMSDPRAALEDVIRTALTGRDRARRNLRPDARRRADEVFAAAVLKQFDEAVKITHQRIADLQAEFAKRDEPRERLLEALRDELTEARAAQQAPDGARTAPESPGAPGKAPGKAGSPRTRTARPRTAQPKAET